MITNCPKLCIPVTKPKNTYPNYRKMVCGKDCLYLNYINHNAPIPIWRTKCNCFDFSIGLVHFDTT